ncbi:MAG: PH domain-containing protein [Planctomycetales bacterium]|nr:PH domain-containing protein [Planctomycetales bacterium]
MHCDQCGVEVAEQAVFCHRCGHKLGSDSDSAPTPMQQFAAAGGGAGARDTAEEELWQGSYSPRAMIGTWIFAGFVTILGVVVGVLSGLLPVVLGFLVLVWLGLAGLLTYRRLDVSYRLTNQRFFHKKGILQRVTDRIEVIDMDDVTCTQGIIERMFGVGTITITSSDQTHPVLNVYGIDNAQEIAQMMDDARREERLRRGIHIESV